LPSPPLSEKPAPPISPELAGLIIVPASDVGPVPPEPTESAPTPADLALRARVNATLSEFGARADRYSVTIAMSSSLAGFAALEQSLSAVRCPWFSIDLDPVAILRDEWS